MSRQKMKKYRIPILMFLVFEAVAVILWLALHNIFYLYNFSYIGCCISVGSYMLVCLGLICHENMQIEGFWFYRQVLEIYASQMFFMLNPYASASM